MRRSRALLKSQIAIIVGLILISVTAGSPIFAGTAAQSAHRLDDVHIYFAESNKEASPFDRGDTGLSRLGGLLQNLGAQLYSLDWRRDIPADADLVVIAGPWKDLGPDQTARLWAYLSNGGSLLLIVEPLVWGTTADGVPALEMNNVLASDKGFFELTWSNYGIRARDDVVVTESGDAGAGLITDFTTTSVDASHPITAGLENELGFFGSRSIEFDASVPTFHTTPLAFSGDKFYGESNYADYLQNHTAEFNLGVDTPRGFQALAVAAEDPTTSARIVLIGDREFATNGGGLQSSPPSSAGFLYPGNVQFLLNSVAWLVGADTSDTVELALPTPGPTATATPVVPAASTGNSG
jgi:hypothetical protein